jgi:hypothetical protein
MSLYNIIQNQSNKYIPFYILPEPTIMYLYNNKPIIKSIQDVRFNEKKYLNRLTSDNFNDIDNDNTICEAIYIRIRRTDTNTKSEWKQFIQKS